MEFRDILKQNVEEAKRKEQERKEMEYQERLKECEDIIKGIKDDIINASLKGETSIVVRRIEDTIIGNKSYVNEIKEYFEREGLTVKIKIDNAITSMYSLFNSFNSLEERIRTYYYTIKISWEE